MKFRSITALFISLAFAASALSGCGQSSDPQSCTVDTGPSEVTIAPGETVPGTLLRIFTGQELFDQLTDNVTEWDNTYHIQADIEESQLARISSAECLDAIEKARASISQDDHPIQYYVMNEDG